MEDSVDKSSTQPAYTVVARRYRPRSFEQLIGQEHVAQALGKAIATGRVGHAYLFTGARGVGKTSTARIFAKALNLQEGVSSDLADEITAAVDSGDDIDVIEIDGASNRGINEIRQLRANVNVRPSRARFKIYIIDEVHMLTKEAFNALLKTLEEPPAHVKFIFCTTDPDKIPITVLSRCQRFDFVPVKFEAIVTRLQEIATNEGYECEPEALSLLARRAAGSMRDSQSLLEQVMSFSVGKITAEQVHSLLGIADETLLLRIVDALYRHDALEAISAADAALTDGADAGQLTEQLLNYLRDIMAVGVGGSANLLKYASPLNHARLKEIADAWGVQTVLSAIQILDESIVRMRASVSAGTLLEVAMVQICQLEQLASIGALIAALGGGAVAQKKKPHDIALASVGRADPEPPGNGSTQNAQSSETGIDGQSHDNQSHEAGAVAEPVYQSLSDALKISREQGKVQQSNTQTSNAHSNAQPNSPSTIVVSHAASGQGAAGGNGAKPPHVAVALAQAQQSEQASSVPQPHTHLKPTSPPSGAALVTASVVNQQQHNSGGSATAASSVGAKPQTSAAPAASSSRFSSAPIGSTEAMAQWKRATQTIDGLLANYCNMVLAIEPKDSTAWRVVFPPGANQPLDYCENVTRKAQLTNALAQVLGRTVQLHFEMQPGQAPAPTTSNQVNSSAERTKRIRELASHPLIKKIVEMLDGEITKVIPPRPPSPQPGDNNHQSH